jgi:predicted transcriptional regulator
MFGGLTTERAFNALSDKGLIVWKQVHSVYASSQTDHYEVTPKGMRMLDKVRKAFERIAKPKKAKRS